MTVNISISNLAPKTQRLRWPTVIGLTEITITNHEDHPLTLQIEGQDIREQCHFEFQLPHEALYWARQVEFTVPAGQAIRLTIRLTAPQTALINLHGTLDHHFTISVTSLTDPPMTRAVLGELSQASLIGPLTLLGLLLLGLLLMSPMVYWVWDTLQPTMTNSVTGLQPPTAEPRLTQTEWRATVVAERLHADATRFYGQPYEQLFHEMAPVVNVNWSLLAEIAYRESRLQSNALGPDNQLGLMQIPLQVWEERAETLGLLNPYEPYSNLLLAVDYLAALQDRCLAAGYRGEHWLLAAYKLGSQPMEMIFSQNGSWKDVPPHIRRYALDLLGAAAASKSGPGQVASQQALLRYQDAEAVSDTPFWWQRGSKRLSTSPLNDIYHQIGADERVADIAKGYGVSVETILAYPDNQEALIQAGEWLIIPQAIVPTTGRVSPTGSLPKDALIGSGLFIWPITKDLSQEYSTRHPAIDIRGRLGTPIKAVDSGYVLAAGWSGPYGNRVLIDHGTGFQTLYAHLQTTSVQVGDNVVKGQAVGQLGSTGNSTGPHLHLEIIQGDVRHNPLTLLP